MIDKSILVASTHSWEGSFLPRYPKEQPEIVVMRISIPPGEKLPVHKHPIINAGYILQGELTVEDELGDTHVFHAGDAIIEMVNKKHYGENRGTETVELVMFYAAVPDIPLSEE